MTLFSIGLILFLQPLGKKFAALGRDFHRAPAQCHEMLKLFLLLLAVLPHTSRAETLPKVAAKAAGKMRLEGKDYVMRDGDVVEFRFNV